MDLSFYVETILKNNYLLIYLYLKKNVISKFIFF